MPIEHNGKFYLKNGDYVDASPIQLEYKENIDEYVIADMTDTELSYYDDDGEAYPIHYDFSIPKDDPFYAKPYYEK